MRSPAEWIIASYFESLGFFVRSEETLSTSPGDRLRFIRVVREGGRQEALSELSFQFFSADIARIHRVSLLILPWEEQVWDSSLIKNSRKLSSVIKRQMKGMTAESIENAPDPDVLLPVPAWPTGDKDRASLEDELKSFGLLGVVTFRSMLSKLVETQESAFPGGNSLLLTLRMLRAFGLLNGPQRDFWEL